MPEIRMPTCLVPGLQMVAVFTWWRDRDRERDRERERERQRERETERERERERERAHVPAGCEYSW